MFTPIMVRQQVPEVGQGFETPFLDLKAHPDAYKEFVDGKQVWKEFEAAKDVAAFANRSGGTILVGATQDTATGRCTGHAPFAADLATKFETFLRDVLEKRCKPRPMVQFDVIPFGQDVMVAINVWAFPGQAVAVKVRGDKRDGYGDSAYVFPVRVLSHTDYLPAEQTPMLMSADVRRNAVLLSTLKSEATITCVPKMLVEADQNTRPFDVKFIRLDEMKNCILVDAGPPRREVGIPLDQVSVWFEGERCHVQCDRRLVVRRP